MADVVNWPERLTLRDTKVNADEGQRIFTTATGYGYEKQEYVRADLSQAGAGGGVVVSKDVLKAAIRRGTADEVNGVGNGDIIVKGCEFAEYVYPEDAAEAFVDAIADEVLDALAPSPSAEAAALSPEERERRLNAAVEARKKQEPGPLPMWSPSPPATPVQPTASVEAADIVYAIREMTGRMEGGKFVQQYALSFEEAQKLIASLTPAPTQGDGVPLTPKQRVMAELDRRLAAKSAPSPAPAGEVREAIPAHESWRYGKLIYNALYATKGGRWQAVSDHDKHTVWYPAGYRFAVAAALSSPATDGEATNKAEAILRRVRQFIAAEDKHERLMSAGKELETSRDDADFHHAQLVSFTVADCDAALRIVSRRRAALSNPAPGHGEAER